jgi:hypothetical protein
LLIQKKLQENFGAVALIMPEQKDNNTNNKKTNGQNP